MLLTNAAGADATWAATCYVARISSEDHWQNVFFNPLFASYTDDYLLAGALSKTYARVHEGALQFEAEANIAHVFTDQSHWQFNLAPVMARWREFPWNHSVATTAAFGLGLSYASELPELEVELEGDSQQLLVFWVAEVTLGPVDAPWSVSFRLHHRSVGYGLFGEKGGMNAVGIGVRYSF